MPARSDGERYSAGERYTVTTLEAFADTLVPGEKRSPGDVAVAGAAAGPGAVAAGAVELLYTPATGIADGLADGVRTLNGHAAGYAAARDLKLLPDLPPFAALPFSHRSALLSALTGPGHPEKDIWILVALFCFMAFDTAAHLNTAAAVRAGHPGLATMGFAAPGPDGRWRFPDYSYGRPLADLHAQTTASGDPA